MELFENTGMNKHTIKLIEEKQPFHGPIYTLCLVKLETLKAYIETYLKSGFIWSSKLSVGALILFDKKPDQSLFLCVNYRGLNNLTIKNWHLLLLIDKILNRQDWAK